MTPKEKAKELVNKYDFDHNEFDYSKEYALIAVDEIIKANPHSNPFNTDVVSTMKYWNEVRHEIEKL